MRRFSRPGGARFRARAHVNNRWFGTSFNTAGGLVTNTSVASWLLSPQDVSTLNQDLTLRRLYCVWNARLTTAQAASTHGYLAVGIIAIRGLDPDNATVPTDYPDPTGDPDSDWVFWNMGVIVPGYPIGTLISQYQDERWFSSRAQRKLSRGDGLLVVVESSNASGNIDLTGMTRFLCTLK